MDKLYLEFGGKLFDDYHASSVLPGFEPDSKLRILRSSAIRLRSSLSISAKDIEKIRFVGILVSLMMQM